MESDYKEKIEVHNETLFNFYTACKNILSIEKRNSEYSSSTTAHKTTDDCPESYFHKIQVKEEPIEYINNEHEKSCEKDYVNHQYIKEEYHESFIKIEEHSLASMKSEINTEDFIESGPPCSSHLQDISIYIDEPGNYECYYCNRSYRFKKYLIQHIRRCQIVHNEKLTSSKTNACDEKPDKEEITSNFIGCTTGKTETVRYDKIKNVKRRNHKQEKKTEKSSCQLDGKLLGDITVSRTNIEKKFWCSNCDRKFPQKASLMKHLTSKTCLIICPICNYMPRKPCELKRHMVKHTKERINCPYCSKKFPRQYMLKKHLKNHTTNQYFSQTNGIDMNSFSSSEQPKFECKHCLIYFQSKANYEKHMEKHLSGDNNVKPFVCRFCCKRYTKKHTLNHHMNFCNGNSYQKNHSSTFSTEGYFCMTCSRHFKYAESLRIHRAEHSVEELKPYGCAHCGKRFIQRYSLINHLTKCS